MATEDIDLTWRLLLAGWHTSYEPAALVGMEVPSPMRCAAAAPEVGTRAGRGAAPAIMRTRPLAQPSDAAPRAGRISLPCLGPQMGGDLLRQPRHRPTCGLRPSQHCPLDAVVRLGNRRLRYCDVSGFVVGLDYPDDRFCRQNIPGLPRCTPSHTGYSPRSRHSAPSCPPAVAQPSDASYGTSSAKPMPSGGRGTPVVARPTRQDCSRKQLCMCAGRGQHRPHARFHEFEPQVRRLDLAPPVRPRIARRGHGRTIRL